MKKGFEPVSPALAHGAYLSLGPKSVLMGILNVTPDSFSDGGKFIDAEQAATHVKAMIAQGASIIDVGGESTRPGADPVDGETERARVLPIIEALARNRETLISVDTYRAKTAAAAVEAGAHIVNDIWGCQREPDIAGVAADTGAGLIIMNNRRDRSVMDDLLDDAIAFFEKSLVIATNAGVKESQIILDPGFGFSDTTDDDLPLLGGLERLHELGYPLLVGTSRKRFLGKITGRDPSERGVATAATSVVARMKGATVFRVHDIAHNRDALAVADALIEQGLK